VVDGIVRGIGHRAEIDAAVLAVGCGADFPVMDLRFRLGCSVCGARGTPYIIRAHEERIALDDGRRGVRPRPGAHPANSRPFESIAAELWKFGLWPIPLIGDGDGKPPHVKGFTRWQRRPSFDALARWAKRWPDANVGLLTGRGVTVIDIDDRSLTKQMIERFGWTPLMIATPSGGRHLYYRSSGEPCSDLRPTLPVDIKGLGGYVAAPPSRRPAGRTAGRRYRILKGSWDDINQLPALRPGSVPTTHTGDSTELIRLRAIVEGQRNKTLFKALLRHARSCDTLDALFDVARTINDDSMLEPLPDAEVVKTARSAWRYETEGRNWAGGSGEITITGDEIARLAAHSHGHDMALLYLTLKRAHWGRRSFAASPEAMARDRVIPAWLDRRRYRRTLADLVGVTLLRLEHRGGSRPGDVSI
jgi:hypothetical protein